MTPLTARSVLASALLGEDPPELPVAHLVHLAGLFGINANRARVALSRMAASAARPPPTVPAATGWPATCSTARSARPTAGGARPGRGTAGGAWWWSPPRAGRPRTGRPAGGAWPWPGWPSSGKGCGCGRTTSTSDPDPTDGPRRGRVHGRSRRGSGGPGRPPLGPRRVGPAGPGAPAALDGRTRRAGRSGPRFALSAAVLRHLQADPLLPAELLPAGWPGPALRRTYDLWDRRYREVLAAWGRSA